MLSVESPRSGPALCELVPAPDSDDSDDIVVITVLYRLTTFVIAVACAVVSVVTFSVCVAPTAACVRFSVTPAIAPDTALLALDAAMPPTVNSAS